jgi:tRNA uridine 5-carboxymethylaminomethyl modification enzyme
LRLTPIGHRIGLASTAAFERAEEKRRQAGAEIERLRGARLSPSRANPLLERLGSSTIVEPVAAERLLARPELTLEDLLTICAPPSELAPGVREHVEVEVKYRGYIERSSSEIERAARLEDAALPRDLAYGDVRGLSTEAREKLIRIQPTTVAQAARIPGVSPADVGVLLIHLKASRLVH